MVKIGSGAKRPIADIRLSRHACSLLTSRNYDAQSKKWRRAEEERRAAKALKESKDEILRIIDSWDKAKRIDQFMLDIQKRASDLHDEERLNVLERLKRARELFGSVDALEHFLAWRSPKENRSDS